MFTPLEIMPRLRGRSHFGAAKARCSLRASFQLGERPSGPAAATGLDFIIILAGYNPLRQRLRGECPAGISNGVYGSLSMMVATPWPPPTHALARP